LNPYHWIYYSFCLIFKDFSIKNNTEDNLIRFIDVNDEITKTNIYKIYAYLSNKIMISDNILKFDELVSLVNTILNIYNIEKICQIDSKKECLAILKKDSENPFYNASDVLPLSISKDEANNKTGYENPNIIQNMTYNNFPPNVEKSLFIQNKGLLVNYLNNDNKKNYEFASNRLLYDKSNVMFEDFSNMQIKNEIHNIQNSILNNYNNYLLRNVKNNLINQSDTIRKNSKGDYETGQEIHRKNNVININNYFQISNTRPNNNINGNFYNVNYNSINPLNFLLNRNSPLDKNQDNFGCSNINLTDNSIDQKLKEYESKNRLNLSNFELFCLANNFNSGYGFFPELSGYKDLGMPNLFNNIYKDNPNYIKTNSSNTENEFLGNKRKSSNFDLSSIYVNKNNNHDKLIFQKDYQESFDNLNNTVDYNLNLDKINIDKKNLDSVKKNNNVLYIKEYENLGIFNNFNGIDYFINKNDRISNKNYTMNKEKEMDKREPIPNKISKKTKNFEIKKVDKTLNEGKDKENNINSSSNIFNIQNIPKMKKTNSLLNSMTFFNDKIIKNNENFLNSNNESSKNLCVDICATLNKSYARKDVPFEIKNEKKKPLKSENSFYCIEKSFSEPKINQYNEQTIKKENQYSDIISNIFNDIIIEKKKDDYKEGYLPIDDICNGFYIKPNKSRENNSQDKDKIKKIKKNCEKDKNIEPKAHEKLSYHHSNSNNIFNITKKICMNNVRSRLGNLINFKRRKLSIENIRNKSLKKIQILNKAIENNSLNKDSSKFMTISENLGNLENALIDINDQKIVLNKNILNHFLNDVRNNNGQQAYFKSRGNFKKKNNNSIYKNQDLISIGIKENRIISKTNKKKKRKKNYNKESGFESNNLRYSLNSIINSNDKINNFIQNSRTKSKTTSRKLFPDYLNEKEYHNRGIFIKDKEVSNINSSPRTSKISSNLTYDIIKSVKKNLKNQERNISDETSNLDCFECLNVIKNMDFENNSGRKLEKRNIKISERYISYQKDFIEDKINSVKIEIQNYANKYPKDLELKLLDEKHVFMKNNFPIMYELENFYLFISSKKEKKLNLNENTAEHSKITEIFNQETMANYIQNIKITLLRYKNERNDKNNINNSNLSKDVFDHVFRKINEVKNNYQYEKISNSILNSDISIANTRPEFNESRIINKNSTKSDIDYKIIFDHSDHKNQIKKEENGKNLTKIKEIIIKNNIELDEFNNFIVCEDQINQSIGSEKQLTKDHVTNYELKKKIIENPISQNRLWSPYVFDNDQSNLSFIFLFVKIF
jgi:hypothetical protein